MKLKLLLFFVAILSCFNASGQELSVSGKVTDETNQPVPGASIEVKGGTATAISDIDGNYQISAPAQGTLIVTYVGYATQEVAIGNRTQVDVSLQPSAENIDEVVVIGYGTQKKSVVTGAISKVSAKELESMPVVRVEQSLQGRTSGVTIAATAGQPGSSATVRVRGITTLNNNNPLWVVDGVVIDNGGIGYLNQADIESIEVLKDAASAAIYGTRGAAGVILITTKKGKSGKLSLNYNGFTGISSPARKLDLLNAREYATLRNEAYAAGYEPNPNIPFQLPYPNASSLGAGTDWQDAIFNDNAFRQTHELSVSGGSDKSTFLMSFGLNEQEGIVMKEISRYFRKNFTINSVHKVTDYLTLGQNFSYSNQKTMGIGNTNDNFGGPLASAINLDPVTPLVVTDINAQPNAVEYVNNAEFIVRDPNGNPYGISNAVGQEMTNPLAYAYTRKGNYGWSDDFVGSAFAEFQPIKGLKIRSMAGGKLAYWGAEFFNPKVYLSATQNVTRNSLGRQYNRKLDWNVENTVSYSRLIGKHNFTVLAGQSYYVDNLAKGNGTTYFDLPVNTAEEASFAFDIPSEDRTTYAYTNYAHNISSLFGRIQYDYDEKYLFQGVIRRDGSTRFGSNNKYGTFPSLSVGWVPSREEFWPENDVVTFLKIRGGYGITGNDTAADLAYLSLISGGNNYTIGTGGYTVVGNSPNRPANPDLRWEETTQRNIGIDATLFRNLNLTVEVFQKKTTGILREQPLPGYVGATVAPFANVADLENRGLEVELNYSKKFGDFNVSLSGNVSFLKTETTFIGQDADFLNGPSIQSSAYPISRAEVGQPYYQFYGFQTAGIFQNQAEIDAHVSSDGTIIQPDAVPGDFRYRDLNDDGQIDADDRKYIGNPLPDCTFGFTVNLEYKNFDFRLFAQGVAGNQIYKGFRRLDVSYANWTGEAINRWHGEGTSNSYPRVTTNDTNGNFTNPSDFFIEDGDYLRFKVVQLGYSLPTDVVGKIGMSKARLYVSGENLLTFTKYSGFDPEIGGDVFGIDRGYYPQPVSLMLGVNLQF